MRQQYLKEKKDSEKQCLPQISLNKNSIFSIKISMKPAESSSQTK